MLTKWLAVALAILAVARDAAAEEAPCARERAAMIETIRAHAKKDPAALPQGISEDVLKVMAAIERHRFIPDGTCAVGYVDRPVSIGHRSTISQPFIVALMTHLAEVAPDHTSLEIGTGSGYQAAILARLAKQVCTVELVAPLAVGAMKVLGDLGHDNARVRVGDGYQGWPECGPFDSDHRHGGDRACAVAADRAAQGRRQACHAARASRQRAVPHGGREDRARRDQGPHRDAGALRAVRAAAELTGASQV